MVSATPRNTHKLSVVRNIQDDEHEDLGAREVHRSIEMILLLHSFLSWEQQDQNVTKLSCWQDLDKRVGKVISYTLDQDNILIGAEGRWKL